MFDKLKPKSEFNKNIFTLLSGTIIAQAIPIAIGPILTRIYAPEDFGVFALFLAISSIFGTIVSLRYEMAIMLPKKDEDAINILAIGLIATCFMSLVFLVLIIVFGDFFVARLGNKEIGFWLYLIPLTVFFLGIFNLLSYFNIRKKNYVNLKNATIIKSIIFSAVQLCLGVIKPGAGGLILGDIASKMFANLQLLKSILQDKTLISKISKTKILALVKKYKDFPIYNTISSLFNAVSGQLVFIMLPKIFGFIVSGYFFLPNKMIDLSSALISNSISQVYLQNISENKNKNLQNLSLFKSTLKKLFLIALCVSVVGYTLSPYIFPFIFGQSWAISGEIAQYIFVIFLIKFCVRPLQTTLISYMELKKLAFWQYLYFITSVSLFIISLQLKLDLNLFLILFVFHEYLLYSICLYLIYACVKKFDKKIIK